MISRMFKLSLMALLTLFLVGCGSSTPSLMTLLDKKGKFKMEWQKLCGDIDGHELPGEGNGVCWTKYEKLSQKNGKVTLFTGIRMGKTPEEQVAVFAVPYGVDLDKGMRVKFDHEAPIALKFTHCSSTMCYAQMPMTNQLLIKFKYSSRLVIAIMSKYNKAYGYRIPLYRFVFAYNKKAEV